MRIGGNLFDVHELTEAESSGEWFTADATHNHIFLGASDGTLLYRALMSPAQHSSPSMSTPMSLSAQSIIPCTTTALPNALFTQQLKFMKLLPVYSMCRNKDDQRHVIQWFILAVGFDEDDDLLKAKVFSVQEEHEQTVENKGSRQQQALVSLHFGHEWHIYDRERIIDLNKESLIHAIIRADVSPNGKMVSFIFHQELDNRSNSSGSGSSGSNNSSLSEQHNNQQMNSLLIVDRFETPITTSKVSAVSRYVRSFNPWTITNAVFVQRNSSAPDQEASLFVTAGIFVYEIEMLSNLRIKSRHDCGSQILPNCAMGAQLGVNGKGIATNQKLQSTCTSVTSLAVISARSELFVLEPTDELSSSLDHKIQMNLGHFDDCSMSWFKHYLVIIFRRPEQSAYGSGKKSSLFMRIVDVKHQLVVYDQCFKSNIEETNGGDRPLRVISFVHSSSIHVILKDSSTLSVLTFNEKTIQNRINILKRRHLYDYALYIISNSKVSHREATSASIHLGYGDFLFENGKYQRSIAQYIQTIRHVESSYIIQKFLELEDKLYLLHYLYALHEMNEANQYHTKLMFTYLLQLTDFVLSPMKMENSEDSKDQALPFQYFIDLVNSGDVRQILHHFVQNVGILGENVVVAVKLLTEKGFVEQSLVLAEAAATSNIDYELHDWIIKIYLENMKHDGQDFKSDMYGLQRNRSFDDALKHIESLSVELASKFLIEYGVVLLEKLPQETTNVLIRISTSYKSMPLHIPSHHRVWTASDDEVFNDANICSPEKFIPLFLNRSDCLLIFLEVVTRYYESKNSGTRLSNQVYNTLLELYLNRWQDEQQQDLHIQTIKYVPRDQMYHSPYGIRPVYEEDLVITWESKIMNLLSMDEGKKDRYDQEHVLLLLQSKNFEKGILYLYDRMGLDFDIIQYLIDKNDADIEKQYSDIFSECSRYPNDSNIWIRTLSYFLHDGKSRDPERAGKYIDLMLREVASRNIIPPLVLIKLLASADSSISLSQVKAYIRQQLQRDQNMIQKHTNDTAELLFETGIIGEEVQTLRTKAQLFQSSLCHKCGTELELPVVHFMCTHSYHQRCLEAEECPKCAKGHREATELVSKSCLKFGETHDEFYKRLNYSSDSFKIISEVVGTGVFGPAQ